jgi:hypothetical protein
LNGWRGDQNKYRVENNMLICFEKGDIETIKEYQNFVMRFEFRITRGTDNGVHVRNIGGKKAFKLQIADDSYFGVDKFPTSFSGSIMQASLVAPARRGSLKPLGQWNAMEITADGSQIRVVLNDQIVLETDIRNTVISNRFPEDAGLHNKSGHLTLTGWSGQTEFRNIRVKELP